MKRVDKEQVDFLVNTYDEMHEDAKKSMSKLEALIEKAAMAPEQVEDMINRAELIDEAYPELDNIERITKGEGISAQEYAALYKKIAEDIREKPEKYEKHVKASGMPADELALLFEQINGSVEKYPEIWESKDAAQMLNPRNLAILVSERKKR